MVFFKKSKYEKIDDGSTPPVVTTNVPQQKGQTSEVISNTDKGKNVEAYKLKPSRTAYGTF